MFRSDSDQGSGYREDMAEICDSMLERLRCIKVNRCNKGQSQL